MAKDDDKQHEKDDQHDDNNDDDQQQQDDSSDLNEDVRSSKPFKPVKYALADPTKKDKYTKYNHPVSKWIKSYWEPEEVRTAKNEDFVQYSMDRFIGHVVGKQLAIGGGFHDQTWFAGSDRYKAVAAKAQDLIAEANDRMIDRHLYGLGRLPPKEGQPKPRDWIRNPKEREQ